MEYAPLISSEEFIDRDVNRNYHAAGIGFGFDEHSHPWAHTIKCTQGSIKVTVDGTETTITPSSETITFTENSLHKVEVLEDNTEFYTEHPRDLSSYNNFE